MTTVIKGDVNFGPPLAHTVNSVVLGESQRGSSVFGCLEAISNERFSQFNVDLAHHRCDNGACKPLYGDDLFGNGHNFKG